MANIIAKTQRPTLILAHNKTLAGQLYSEFKELFPTSNVGYFISFYDYYQPEAYIASSDTYIEKDSSINDEIDELRHSATNALISRKDVIVVASVSCIYGIGEKEEYEKIERTIITTYRKQIWAKYVKAINEYNMIQDGDKIGICISGGKDSMLLAKCFQELN